MSKFDYLKKLDIENTKIVDYPILQIEDKPILKISPATEINKPYFNSLLRRARKTNKAVQAGAVNANLIEANRNEDRELYAQYIIKGWSGVKDENGNEVPYTQADCLEFLNALPGYIFDQIREFASNTLNFVEDVVDVEGTSKN